MVKAYNLLESIIIGLLCVYWAWPIMNAASWLKWTFYREVLVPSVIVSEEMYTVIVNIVVSLLVGLTVTMVSLEAR